MKALISVAILPVLSVLLLAALPCAFAASAYHFETSWTNAGPIGDPHNFNGVSSMVVDSQGRLYITEDKGFLSAPEGIQSPITVLDAQGTLLHAINGVSPLAKLQFVDESDNVWVRDIDAILIYGPTGLLLRQVDAGLEDMLQASDLAPGPEGEVYALYRQEFLIKVFDAQGGLLRQFPIPPSPEALEKVGDRYDEWISSTRRFGKPGDLAVSTEGDILVHNCNRVMTFSAQGELLSSWVCDDGPVRIELDGGGSNGLAYGALYDFHLSVDGLLFLLDEIYINVFTREGQWIGQWSMPHVAPSSYYTATAKAVATGPQGEIYIANHHAIALYSPDGQVLETWSTLDNGVYELNSPNGVAVTGSGNICILDTYPPRVYFFTPAGELLQQWTAQSTADKRPDYVSLDPNGDVHISYTSGALLQTYDQQGVLLREWSIHPDTAISNPGCICSTGAGAIYVADNQHHRVLQFTEEGEFLMAWGQGVGVFTDGPFPSSVDGNADPEDGEFGEISSIAIAPDGSIVTADTHFRMTDFTRFNRIQVFTPQGECLRSWGSAVNTMQPEYGPGDFGSPGGLAFAPDDDLLVVDKDNNSVHAFTLQDEFLTTFGQSTNPEQSLEKPKDLAIAPDGRVYVLDRAIPDVKVFAPARTADVSGFVAAGGAPLCALVLANGKICFSSAADGGFALDAVPLDATGGISLQVFCDGFAPYAEPLTPSQGRAVRSVNLAPITDNAQELQVTCNLYGDASPYTLSGLVRMADDEATPLAALVLANGVAGFSSATTGAFELTGVPLDEQGGVTLFVFCQGTRMYKQWTQPES